MKRLTQTNPDSGPCNPLIKPHFSPLCAKKWAFWQIFLGGSHPPQPPSPATDLNMNMLS